MIDFINEVFVLKQKDNSYCFLFKANTSVIDIFGVFIKTLNPNSYTVFKNKIFFKTDVLLPVELFEKYYTLSEDTGVSFTLTEIASTFKYLCESKSNVYSHIFNYIHSKHKEYSEHFFDTSILNTENTYIFSVPKTIIKNMDVKKEKVKGTSDIVLFYNKIVGLDIDSFTFTFNKNNKLKVLSLTLKQKTLNLLETKNYLTNLKLQEYTLDLWYPQKPFSSLTKEEFKRFIKLNFNLDEVTVNIVQPSNYVDFFVTKKSIFNE